MIRYAALRKVIGAVSVQIGHQNQLDFFRSAARSRSLCSRSASYNLARKSLRALALFLCWDFSSWHCTTMLEAMGDTNGAVRFVNVLAACPLGAIGVYAQILGINVDIHFFRFR